MAQSLSVSWLVRAVRASDGYISDSSRNLAAGIDNGGNQTGLNRANPYSNTAFDYYSRGVSMGSASNITSESLIICSGGIVGAAYVPYPLPVQDSALSGSFISTYEPTYDVILRTGGTFPPDGVVEVSENGKFYKDNNGNWHDINNDNLVATAQEVSNLPQDVEFNGWLFEHEIIEGSDGNYYDLAGNEVFSNLPSGVIPTSKIVPPSDDGSGNLSGGVYEGTDGNYYNVAGQQILENLPSGVVPSSQIGDVIVGSDGNYYDLHGDGVMENLPSGVTITGYDSQNDSYHGSDGKDYDIHGDEKESGGDDDCDGIELTFTNQIRLTIDCVDIFGNQQNIGADIAIGQTSLDFATIFNFNYIRQINRVTARSLGNANQSVGNGVLRVRGNVVGAKVAVDVEGVDVDAVLGTYEVVACNFDMCDRYATPILNNDLPLGLANHTNLDVGYYVLSQILYFDWEGFNDVFPYCCPSFNNDEKASGSTPNPNEDKDMSKLIESIDKLTEAVQGLSTLVEVVVSPAEDVNIYNRRFHYNDNDGVSGFSS